VIFIINYKVSFIIPTLNRERTIEACLKSIADQTYPIKEIIVVDGGSRDRTLSIASKYATKIILDKGSLGKARQRGAEEATGQILGIFDSDIVLPTKDWTEKAVQYFRADSAVGIVWPFNKAPEGASIVTRCYFLLWKARAWEFLKQANKRLLVPGGNSLVLRKALETAGGFDTTLKFGEDLELGNRIVRLGYGVAIFKEAILHDTMWSFEEYARKQIWGASSLATASMSVINLCLNWTDNKVSEKKCSFPRSTVGFLVGSFSYMIKGLARDRDTAWLILPLLLGIRIMIYARYLTVRALKG